MLTTVNFKNYFHINSDRVNNNNNNNNLLLFEISKNPHPEILKINNYLREITNLIVSYEDEDPRKINVTLNLIKSNPAYAFKFQSNKKVKKYIKLISETLSNFFKTKIYFEISSSPRYYKNCMVFIDIKPFLKREKSDIDIKNLKFDLRSVKAVYIVFGSKLFYYLTPEESTAIILHELGHVVLKAKEKISEFTKILILTVGLASAIAILKFVFLSLKVVSLSPLAIILRHSILSSIYQREEHFSDKFSVAFGYGDELINALTKIKSITTEKEFLEEEKRRKTVLDKLILKLKELFIIKTHPELEKRIKEIYEEILREYIDDYELEKIILKK